MRVGEMRVGEMRRTPGAESSGETTSSGPSSQLGCVPSGPVASGSSSQDSSTTPQPCGTLSTCPGVTRTAHLKAEVLWALNVVAKNYSFKSCEGVGDLFRVMFPDSEVVKQFQCAERKASYLIGFGVVPYLQSQLRDRVKEINDYVILFDESLNAGLQSKQMDILVRFWDGNKVSTRYYTSKFLGHALAETLQDELYDCCVDLGLSGMHQLSMDGPNVNWKAFDLLSTQIERGTRRKLLNVGSCGLHISHNAFRAGIYATEWDIEHTLTCLHWLFKDAPARREDYTSVTGSSVFGLKFCPHRWIENVPVVERALLVWPNVQQYVAAVRAGTVPRPKNKSFQVLSASADNILFTVHLNVFLTIAKVVTPFLTKYQTDAPMLPFIRNDLQDLVRDLLARFMQKSVLDKANTITKLLRVDPCEQTQHVASHSVDIGFAAEQSLRELKRSKKASERDCLAMRLGAKSCLIAVTQKILEKSPVNYPLARNLNWLVPDLICRSPDACVKQLKRCLSLLSESGHVNVSKCDDIVKQFGTFARTAANQDAFLSFQVGKDRLDELLYETIAKRKDLPDLWLVTRTLLLLSHGQATVERGFSINKETMADHMAEHTLIAKRVVKDFLMSVGGKVSDVTVTPQLLAAAASGRQRYQRYLEEQKKRSPVAMGERGKKRRAEQEELDELKAKRKRLEGSIQALTESADKYADEAESTGKITLLSQSNAHRRSAKEKTKELNILNKAIVAKEHELKFTL